MFESKVSAIQGRSDGPWLITSGGRPSSEEPGGAFPAGGGGEFGTDVGTGVATLVDAGSGTGGGAGSTTGLGAQPASTPPRQRQTSAMAAATVGWARAEGCTGDRVAGTSARAN